MRGPAPPARVVAMPDVANLEKQADRACAHVCVPRGVRNDSVVGLCYHREFVSVEEESELLRCVSTIRWKSLRGRLVQNHGGLPHSKGMIATPLPPSLLALSSSVVRAGIFPEERAPNHALVNRYIGEDACIEPHEDGPVFFPCTAILSMQSHTRMDFYPKYGDHHKTPLLSILLEPRSLLCFRDLAYTNFLHGIRARRDQNLPMYAPPHSVKPTNGLAEPIQRTSITLRYCKPLKTTIKL